MLLKKFESALDTDLDSHQLPHPNYYIAVWYLITVSEDNQRWMFTEHGEHLDGWEIDFQLDSFKFALRHCIAAVARKSNDRSQIQLPEKVVPEIYIRTGKFLGSGKSYSIGHSVCASVYEGNLKIKESEEGLSTEYDEQHLDPRYSALELMRQSAGAPIIPLSAVLWTWTRHSHLRPPPIAEIVSSARLSKRRIQYEYSPSLSSWLATYLPQLPFLIPDGWQFPWGGRHETTLLLNALSLRVFYHLCTVVFFTEHIELKGGGECDLTLCITKSQLVTDIYLNSSLPHEVIETFIKFLTLGEGVSTPDQALQPLIPLGKELIGIPGLGLLSSNMERNLLTLQARQDPNKFDSQSALFESGMTYRLADSIRQKWPQLEQNKTYLLGGNREEIDILVWDETNRTILILELRWILSPADPREIQNKTRICNQKVIQVGRKLSRVKDNLIDLFKILGIKSFPSEQWTIKAAVVIEGFGGARSKNSEIPVIPDWVLDAGVQNISDLSMLSKWIVSLAWLPQAGRDYELSEIPLEVDGLTLMYQGIMPKRSGREFLIDSTQASNC